MQNVRISRERCNAAVYTCTGRRTCKPDFEAHGGVPSVAVQWIEYGCVCLEHGVHWVKERQRSMKASRCTVDERDACVTVSVQ